MLARRKHTMWASYLHCGTIHVNVVVNKVVWVYFPISRSKKTTPNDPDHNKRDVSLEFLKLD